jgi:hypothetical protein
MARTIEVLPIELLDKLQHHAINSTFPKAIPRREAFQPSCFPSLIFSPDTEFEFLDSLFHQRIVDGDPVQLCYDLASFIAPASSQQMPTSRWGIISTWS